MVRRHLGYGVREWHALPGSEKEIYLEGLRAEFEKRDWHEDAEESGPYGEERDGGLESLAEMGIGVRVVE